MQQQANSTAVLRGTVKFFMDGKGYGFIETPGRKDVFVHYSAVIPPQGEWRTLKPGQQVEFEIFDGNKGPEARNVVVIGYSQTPVGEL